MSEFNAHKWFKKQYLEEGMSDEEIHAIKRFEELSLDDKLKLTKIQAMMDRERSLREDDLNEISRDAYDRMEGLANERHLNQLKDSIMVLGEDWANEGFENGDIADYLEALVYQLVRS
jgi:hypothetical protein